MIRTSDEVSLWKLATLAVLALFGGVLAFNFSHILQVSHVHLSLANNHKTKAFCNFAGGCSGKATSVRLTSVGAASVTPTKETTKQASMAVAVADPPASEETTKALSARVCGSPAIDGYSHVVVKCLEDSPTAKWWADYYAKGGKQSDLLVHLEKGADYDGLAVAWGLGNKKTTAEECALQCLTHMPGTIDGPFKNLPCNTFSWCPDDVCFVPDAHHHTKGDCWIKFTEGPAYPEINMRGELPPDFHLRHPNAPKTVQWWGGVLLPPGVKPTNGTFGPRWKW